MFLFLYGNMFYLHLVCHLHLMVPLISIQKWLPFESSQRFDFLFWYCHQRFHLLMVPLFCIMSSPFFINTWFSIHIGNYIALITPAITSSFPSLLTISFLSFSIMHFFCTIRPLMGLMLSQCFINNQGIPITSSGFHVNVCAYLFNRVIKHPLKTLGNSTPIFIFWSSCVSLITTSSVHRFTSFLCDWFSHIRLYGTTSFWRTRCRALHCHDHYKGMAPLLWGIMLGWFFACSLYSLLMWMVTICSQLDIQIDQQILLQLTWQVEHSFGCLSRGISNNARKRC